MQQLEKERQKPQGSICTSSQEWLKSYKMKNLHLVSNHLKEKKKYL
jgi:hypothetical protein